MDSSAPATNAGSAREPQSKTENISAKKSETAIKSTTSVRREDGEAPASVDKTHSKKQLKPTNSTASKPAVANDATKSNSSVATRRMRQSKKLPPFPAYHAIIKALPRPTLPVLKKLPYYAKLPVLCSASKLWRLSTTPLGVAYTPRVPQADFDLSDPYCHETDITYRPLNDVHLREYLNKPMIREQLKYFDLATEEDRVRCNAKEYNDWRKLMYRTWLRAVNEIRKEVHLFEQVNRMQETARLVRERVGLVDESKKEAEKNKPDFIDSEWIPLDMRKDIFSRYNNRIARVAAEKARDEARQEVLDQYVIANSFEKELHHVQRYLKRLNGQQSDRKKRAARKEIARVKRHEHSRRMYAMSCEKKSHKRQEVKDWWIRHKVFQTKQQQEEAVTAERDNPVEQKLPKRRAEDIPVSAQQSDVVAQRQPKRSVAYNDNQNLLSELQQAHNENKTEIQQRKKSQSNALPASKHNSPRPPSNGGESAANLRSTSTAAASRKQSIANQGRDKSDIHGDKSQTNQSVSNAAAAPTQRKKRAMSKITTHRRDRKSQHISSLNNNTLVLEGPTGRPKRKPSYSAQIKVLYGDEQG